MADCNPCAFCVHQWCSFGSYYEPPDSGCDADVDFDPSDNKPCASFKPILVSDSLMQQLSDEYEYEFYKRQAFILDCKSNDCTNCQYNGDCDRQDMLDELRE